MTKRTIILPTRDNNGASLAREIASCETDLLLVAGGFTRFDSAGKWTDADGTIYVDESRVYFAIVDADADARILAMLPVWCERLRQLALYTDSTECEVSFIGQRAEVKAS